MVTSVGHLRSILRFEYPFRFLWLELMPAVLRCRRFRQDPVRQSTGVGLSPCVVRWRSRPVELRLRTVGGRSRWRHRGHLGVFGRCHQSVGPTGNRPLLRFGPVRIRLPGPQSGFGLAGSRSLRRRVGPSGQTPTRRRAAPRVCTSIWFPVAFGARSTGGDIGVLRTFRVGTSSRPPLAFSSTVCGSESYVPSWDGGLTESAWAVGGLYGPLAAWAHVLGVCCGHLRVGSCRAWFADLRRNPSSLGSSGRLPSG